MCILSLQGLYDISVYQTLLVSKYPNLKDVVEHSVRLRNVHRDWGTFHTPKSKMGLL